MCLYCIGNFNIINSDYAYNFSQFACKPNAFCAILQHDNIKTIRSSSICII